MNALKVEGEKGRAFEINLKNPLQKRYEISARSVARVLSEHGITLKKRRNDSLQRTKRKNQEPGCRTHPNQGVPYQLRRGFFFTPAVSRSSGFG